MNSKGASLLGKIREQVSLLNFKSSDLKSHVSMFVVLPGVCEGQQQH